MRNYETTFIVNPALSGDEIGATAQSYVNLLQNEGCKIVAVDEMGLRPLAYTMGKRDSGVYYCIEFEATTGDVISKLEITFRRDEHRIVRFLTVALDKYGVQYNQDKRDGKINKVKKKEKVKDTRDTREHREPREPREVKEVKETEEV